MAELTKLDYLLARLTRTIKASHPVVANLSVMRDAPVNMGAPIPVDFGFLVIEFNSGATIPQQLAAYDAARAQSTAARRRKTRTAVRSTIAALSTPERNALLLEMFTDWAIASPDLAIKAVPTLDVDEVDA